MNIRITGKYVSSVYGDETVKAFVPYPLPPAEPAIRFDGGLDGLHEQALAAIGQLAVAGNMVPDTKWFLYGFVRKEAVVSSQIEGTQATLQDVISYEATSQTARTADVEEICNYVEALEFARRQMHSADGLPLCTRLLCEVHKHLMAGVRGAEKKPGEIRTSQNWIGGSRPGTALFVPPPPQEVLGLLTQLEKWIHSNDPLPPLVKAAMAHVQFETIHPFLDGNGRIGRLLVTLLLEFWGLLPAPLLYLSLAFKQHRQEYYRHLDKVRTQGDWEIWIAFFLQCVIESAQNGVETARKIFACTNADRKTLINHELATIYAIRLLDLLPEHPMVTLANTMALLDTSKPTAAKALEILSTIGILKEVTGKRRDRVYAYQKYLDLLAADTEYLT